MRTRVIALAAVGAVCAATACVHEPTPVQRAAGALRVQCADPRESADETRLLREAKVIDMEPITFLAGASTRTEGGHTLSGTKLVFVAPDGVSAEELARVLRCHSAKALLGQVDPQVLPDDPFYLPDTWVDIDVKAEHGFLVVKLSADRIWQNLAVLRRAKAFAGAHRYAAAPTY